MKVLALLPALLLMQIAVFAQKVPMKFGKIEDAEIEMTECAFDPEAHAVVLGEYGNVYFSYDKNKGFQSIFEYHKRVKIFDKEAYDQADIAIPFYDNGGGDKEVVAELKAVTYNLEGGKLEKYKVSNQDEFEEDISENWHLKKFSFSNVKEGSIIEYSYTIISDYIGYLRGWQFQQDLPVVFSEYRMKIPEFYTYKPIFRGDFTGLTVNENHKSSEVFSYSYSQNNLNKATTSNTFREQHTQSVTSESKVSRWKAENKASYQKDVPYVNIAKDYAMQVEFQLIAIRYPNQAPKYIADSYDNRAKWLMNPSRYGSILNHLGPEAQAGVTAAASAASSDIEKAVAVYEHIKQKMQWNGALGELPSQNAKTTYESGTGNVADINLLLTAALNSVSIKANPVVLNTRDAGKPHPIYPTDERLDYVVVCVQLEDKVYLLDAAASNYLPFGELPAKCLNGQGWVVFEEAAKPINLQSGAIAEETIMVQAKLDEEGAWTADITASYKDKYAYSWRRTDKEEKTAEAFQKNLVDWTVSELTWEEENNIYEPLKMKLKLESEAEGLADIIYFNPNVYGLKTENPFKNEIREYPVDMPFGQSRRYVMMITLPEGYVLDGTPQPMMFRLPGNGGSFQYTVRQSGNTVSIMNNLKLTKTFFSVEEYAALRQFFETVIAKNNEQLVFKKEVE